MVRSSIHIQQLASFPPLILEQDLQLFKNKLHKLYHHPKDFFILHIGDCAESFDDCTKDIIHQKSLFYKEMAHMLENQIQKEVILIGRLAGQYAKPRTETFEERDGCILPIYRGDMINGFEFSADARKNNPNRLIQAYDCAQQTIQMLESFHNIQSQKKIFTSHEALILDFEEALTRANWNTSAHTVWLGDRTRHLDSLHVEYLSGIENSIGIKIGPTQSPDSLIDLLKKINPRQDEGKIYLITRLGTTSVLTHLQKLIAAVLKENLPVIWCVDPMHGNTFKLSCGRKVRSVHDILKEILVTTEIHKTMGSVLSGVHLEATFAPVTECIFDTRENAILYSYNEYTTKCDPRLNLEQTRNVLGYIDNTCITV